MLVSALFLAGTFIGPMEQQASAADGRGGRAHGGAVFRGGSDGGRAMSSPRTGGWQRGAQMRSGDYGGRGAYVRGGDYGGRGATVRGGDYGRRGSYVRGGDYVRGGSYSRHDYDRRGSYYRGSGYRHGGYYGNGGYYGHHDHNHGYVSTSIWFGPGWGWSAWDPFYYPYYPYPYYYRYPYYGPSTTVVVPQEPQEYIMNEPGQQETGYWYYCKEARGYYPYVEKCPGGWMRVVPQEPPDADKE
jgi:hypothetical protein